MRRFYLGHNRAWDSGIFGDPKGIAIVKFPEGPRLCITFVTNFGVMQIPVERLTGELLSECYRIMETSNGGS